MSLQMLQDLNASQKNDFIKDTVYTCLPFNRYRWTCQKKEFRNNPVNSLDFI